MSYKEIHALKKEKSFKTEKFFKRHLVIGNDIFAVALYKKLQEKHGDQVFILAKDAITSDSILPVGPSAIRGDDNISYMQNNFQGCGELYSKPSEFFKELKFRQFGGRSKSEKLLWAEEFYTASRLDVVWEKIFPFLKDDAFFTALNTVRLDLRIMEIAKLDPTDLVDPTHFQVKCTNGHSIECEYLYWANSPQNFLELFKSKNELSNNFIQFCESTNGPCVLNISFEFAELITNKQETIFIPLSYTHEWGHFIGEFKTLPDGRQKVDFMTFLDKDQTTEEDISKKIRILKRNLEKIFPIIKKNLPKEFIKISDYSSCLKIDDSMYCGQGENMKYLRIVNSNGPFGESGSLENSCEYSTKGLSSSARAIACLAEVEGII